MTHFVCLFTFRANRPEQSLGNHETSLSKKGQKQKRRFLGSKKMASCFRLMASLFFRSNTNLTSTLLRFL